MQNQVEESTKSSCPYPKDALLYAPLEGITCHSYREAVMEMFPEWDKFSTDFLRVPTQGHYKLEHYKKHLGDFLFQDEKKFKKTTYQILTTTRAQTIDSLNVIKSIGVNHVDLNLGCPSKKVNSHGGGAFLMSNLEDLEKVVMTIRDNFKGSFTTKIRVGYRDDSKFEDAIKLLEGCGVDAITIHARTRDELYKGRANWDYIERAVAITEVPIIANGDVWTLDDIIEMRKRTGCHGIMFGRSAMKTPWLAKVWKLYKEGIISNEDEALLQLRTLLIPVYYKKLEETYRKNGMEENFIFRRLKAVSRYLFEDYEDGESVKSFLMRTKSIDEFYQRLNEFVEKQKSLGSKNILPSEVIMQTIH